MNARLFATTLALLGAVAAAAPTLNGFDLSETLIDREDILRGGPPRDGIPAIDNPKFIGVDAVDFLRDDDIVIGLRRGDLARAYPTRILVWHEVVNDSIGDDAVAVTYCPLCGTGMVFDRDFAGGQKSFGVSGLLYQSDVLLYDRESESLWSQLGLRAVSGAAAADNLTLTWLPAEHLTWRAWREKYPDGEVLSTDTGYARHYGGEAYADYFASDSIMFPVPQTRSELSPKDKIIGVVFDGAAKAYPLNNFPAEAIRDTVGDQSIQVGYDPQTQAVTVTDARGDALPSVVAFWFAWQAFYPQTALADHAKH